MSEELTTTEKYLLAQLFVCGAITEDEFERVSKFSRTVRERRLEELEEKEILQETLYREQ